VSKKDQTKHPEGRRKLHSMDGHAHPEQKEKALPAAIAVETSLYGSGEDVAHAFQKLSKSRGSNRNEKKGSIRGRGSRDPVV